MNYDTALFCEIDKYAIESYCAIHHVPKSLNIGDVSAVSAADVPDFNTMFGGSPCQDFSVAGLQGGAVWTCRQCGHQYNPLEAHYSKRQFCPACGSVEIEKTRSSLLVEWLRFLREKKPRFAIYENVKNITGKKFKHTFDLFIAEIREYGYNVYWQVLNAKDYGVPQNRERVYCVIIRRDLDNGLFKFPDKIPLQTTLQDLLEHDVPQKYYLPDEKLNSLVDFAPPAASLIQCASEEGANPLDDPAGTLLQRGINVKNKGMQFVSFTPTACTLMARDYKSFGNQQMTAVMEVCK